MFVEEVDKGSDIYFFSRETKEDAMKDPKGIKRRNTKDT